MLKMFFALAALTLLVYASGEGRLALMETGGKT